MQIKSDAEYSTKDLKIAMGKWFKIMVIQWNNSNITFFFSWSTETLSPQQQVICHVISSHVSWVKWNSYVTVKYFLVYHLKQGNTCYKVFHCNMVFILMFSFHDIILKFCFHLQFHSTCMQWIKDFILLVIKICSNTLKKGWILAFVPVYITGIQWEHFSTLHQPQHHSHHLPLCTAAGHCLPPSC